MKVHLITAAVALGTLTLSMGARATPFNFDVAIAFDNVAAVNSTGGNAATNLASAAEFTFTPPVTNGPNGNTTGNPMTPDPVLASQLAYPSFLSSTSLGVSGTGGTTAEGGTNTYYFFNFVSINAGTGTTSGNIVGGFETATGSVMVATNTESATFVDVMLTGVFVPSAADSALGYTITPATLNVDVSSNCVQSVCSISASGTLAAGQVASVTPVPEPSGLALFATGIAGLGLVLRRRPA